MSSQSQSKRHLETASSLVRARGTGRTGVRASPISTGLPRVLIPSYAVSIAHRLYPQLPAGDTSYDPASAKYMVRYVPDKERKLLGIKFKTMEETTKDTLEDCKSRGWL